MPNFSQNSAKGPRLQYRVALGVPVRWSGRVPLQGEPPRVRTLSVRDFVAPEHQLREHLLHLDHLVFGNATDNCYANPSCCRCPAAGRRKLLSSVE